MNQKRRWFSFLQISHSRKGHLQLLFKMTLLYFINTLNMQNELIAQPKAYIQNKFGQDDSHTYSYLEARKFYQSLGYIMGFDK